MDKLLVFTKGSYSGYIDQNGNVVIPIEYPVAHPFSEGLASMKDDDCNWWVINEEGDVVFSCDWSVVGDFHDGLAFVMEASQKIGFIDRTGMNVIPCQWKVVDVFSEGLAAVQDENGNYGYINKIGQLVIPYQYKDAKPFQNGLAIVQISDDEWTFIDKAGKRPYSIWAEVQPFSEGLAPVKNTEGLWGYINEKGEAELDFQWADALSFSEGFASVSNGDKYGYINKQGEIVIPCQWNYACSFSEGLAAVDVSMMKWGYINTKGELVVPARWTFACNYNDGVAFVADVMTMESGYIDRTGRFFNPSHPLDSSADESEELTGFEGDFEEGIFNDGEFQMIPGNSGKVYKSNGVWHYIEDPDEIAKIVIDDSEEYDEILPAEISDWRLPHVLLIRQNGKFGIFNIHHLSHSIVDGGTWCNPTAEPFPYDEVKYCAFPDEYPNEYGLYTFRIGDKWGVIKITTREYKSQEVFDDEYPLSKRRIVLPCVYASLTDGEQQLGKKYKWRDPEIYR